MEQFYVTLPSNSSEKFFGRQPMSNYKTMLAKPITLDVDEWEVGLAEIIFPHTWANVTQGKFKIRCLENNNWVFKEAHIDNGLYTSESHLIDALNEAIDDVLTEPPSREIPRIERTRTVLKHRERVSKIQIYVNNVQKVVVHLEEGYALQFQQELSAILGFGDLKSVLIYSDRKLQHYQDYEDYTIYDGSKLVAPFTVDLNRCLNTFFVYCDIIDSQLVGDSCVSLLRAVPVSGKTGDIVAKSFSNIHYVCLNRSTFQSIEIHITDEIGRNIQFNKGRVVIKLHFKKV